MKTIKNYQNFGYKTKFLNVNEDGIFDLSTLKKNITNETTLISLMHVNNEIGVINDIDEISDICKYYNTPFHVDAVQSFGKIKIDLSKTNIDYLSIASHKIHGPKGIGALYVKDIEKFHKIFWGGNQEKLNRLGTENVPAIVGFAKAVRLINNFNFDKSEKMLRDFEKRIIENIDDVIIIGKNVRRVYNTSNICFKNIEGESITNWLNYYNISVSTGSACSSLSLEPSHVLKAINLNPCYLNGAVRFSISKYTTINELEHTFNKLKKIILNLREMSPF